MTHTTANARVRELMEERVLFLAELKPCEQVERASSVLHLKRDSIVRVPRLEATSVYGELVLGDPAVLVPEACS